jgi:prenyltransferase beta subunit
MKRVPLTMLLLLLGLTAARAQSADERQATVTYLARLQNADGGFLGQAPARDGGRGEGSSLRATVAAVRALHYFGGEPRNREACARYVQAAFDPASGGFVNTRPGGKPDVVLTAVGLMGVAALKLPTDRYAGPALKYLGEHARGFEEIRMAAAGAEAAGQRPAEADEWLRQIARMRNPDGTYGKGDGQGRATGSAVAAVLRLGGKVEQRDNVLKALRAGQRKDGGFGKEEAAGSDLETTYRVMRSFHMLKEMPDAAACRAFVARCRNEDGGYGVTPGQPSNVGATYYAGSVLHWLAERQP